MTATLVGVSPPPEPAGAGDAEDRELSPVELAAVEDLFRRARQDGIALTGPDGLLKTMTKTVGEAALEGDG
jgi:putative transposase